MELLNTHQMQDLLGDDSFTYQVCDNVEESVQKCAEAEVVI